MAWHPDHDTAVRLSAAAARRRAFLTRIPLSLAGLATACRATGNEAAAPAGSAPPAPAPAGSAGASGAARPAPLLREIPAAAPTLRWVPDHRDLVYSFGGAAPKHRITSG